MYGKTNASVFMPYPNLLNSRLFPVILKMCQNLQSFQDDGDTGREWREIIWIV